MTRCIAFFALALALMVVLAGSPPVSSQHTSSFNGFQLVDKDGNIRFQRFALRDHHQ